MRRHIMIPDCQVRPGEPTDHLTWIGKYIVEKKPDVVVNIGDFADMPSLSHWDKGTKRIEGTSITQDIHATKLGMSKLMKPLKRYNEGRRRRKQEEYLPRLVMTLGNHEDRINRALNNNAQIDCFGVDDLQYRSFGWEVHEYQAVVNIDGIQYSHFFINPNNGRALGGMMPTRIKNVGQSFSQGHLQTLMWDSIWLPGPHGTQIQRCGLIAGACYLHDEHYKGPQGNGHWRGIVVKNEVYEGGYDPNFVSLDYLCREYEGVGVKEFMWEKYGRVYSGRGVPFNYPEGALDHL